jgi:flagellar hook-length control protein FliK
MLAPDAKNASGSATTAGASSLTLPDGLGATEAKPSEKADLLASILANVDAATSTATPQLAAPSHQASTLTAVALALPVTVPGALDEMAAANGEWPTALGHRVMWAVGEGLQKVEISVTPQDMGPINVHIRVDNDKADIRFTAAHATTRDALEASIPRLRDMFSQQGLNLSQAQVFSQNSQDSRGHQPDARQNQNGSPTGSNAETQEPERAKPLSWRSGLVDDYA